MRRSGVALLLAASLAGCAVKGYELGWRNVDRISPLLGQPLDALSGCRYRASVAQPGPDCAGLARRIGAMAAALPPLADAPESLGARCSADNCSYGNAYERRDVGLALVLPVFRKVVLREVHAHFSRELDGRWALDALSVGDVPPPNYGPLRIGADPTSS